MTNRRENTNQRRYSLTPDNTRVNFITRHLFGLGSVSGSLALVSGFALVDDVHDVLHSVQADLDAATFNSGSKSRDQVVASRRFLNSASHPIIRFRSTHAEQLGDDWLVRGQLTVRGTEAPVEITMSSISHGAAVEITGRGRLDRYAHGMTAAPGLASRHLELEITSTATRGDYK